MNFFGGGGSGGLNPLTVLQQFDRNGDSSITEEDFVLAANDMGLGFVGEHAVRFAFKQVDTNRNGKLEFMEALKAIQKLRNLIPQQANPAI